MPGAHKIGAAISGPRIAGGNFCRHHAFSDFLSRLTEGCYPVAFRVFSKVPEGL